MTKPSSALARKVPFFYGWLIVVSMFAAGMASAGPTLWALSVFAIPMTDDLEWTRATFFGALAARQLLMGALAPIFGRLADTEKWPRILMVFGGSTYALSLVLLSQISNQIQYFLVLSVLGGIGQASGGGILRQAIVAKWFIRRRGRAIAIGSMGTGIAAFVYPLFAYVLIESYGWRSAWIWMGVSSFLLLVPLALLVRRQPEDIGLLPDGETEVEAKARRVRAEQGDVSAAEEHSFTLAEVSKSRTLWLIVLATMITAPSLQGLTSTWVPYFQDIGFSAGVSATALTTYGLFSVLSRIVWGFIVEKYHVRKVIMANGTLIALMVLVLINVQMITSALEVQPAAVVMIFAAFLGIIFGGFVGLNPLLWPNYFGRKFIGSIRGTFMPFITVSSALGPLWINYIFDRTGEYNLAYIILMVTWLIFVGLMFLAKPMAPPKN